MTKKLLLVSILSLSVSLCLSQTSASQSVSVNGFYIGQTGRIEAAKVDIYTYLKFYTDSTVYLQTVTSIDPQDVAMWFGRGKKFSKKGTYSLSGSQITIKLSNKESEDSKVEGNEKIEYAGQIEPGNKLIISEDGRQEKVIYKFYEVREQDKAGGS